VEQYFLTLKNVIETLIRKIFGDTDNKKLKIYQKDLEKIKKIEKTFSNYSQEDILKKTEEFRARFT